MNFSLNEEEVRKFREWSAKHDKNVYTGASGGRYTFSFTPTTLGTVAHVKDCITKEELTLTNFDNW